MLHCLHEGDEYGVTRRGLLVLHARQTDPHQLDLSFHLPLSGLGLGRPLLRRVLERRLTLTVDVRRLCVCSLCC